MNVFKWLSKLNPENLIAIVQIEKEKAVYNHSNWSQIEQCRVNAGEFAAILLIRQASAEIVETGLLHYGKEWETAHPLMLAQINQLEKKVTFAEMLVEYPDCPARNVIHKEDEDQEAEEIFKEVLDLSWPDQEAANYTPIVSPVDEMLEWLEAQPATDLKATVQLGDVTMEFSKENWTDLSGFGRCADDRFNGEITISRTSAAGRQTIAGLLLDGIWIGLAAEGVKNDHGSKYPADAEYVSITEMFNNCPIK